MKISEGSLDLIGNVKFCNLEEAVEYAKTNKSAEAWGYVVNRNDMTLPLALMYAEKLKKITLWKKVLKRTDLAPDSAIENAVSVGSDEVWKSVFSREDVTFKRAHAIALGMGEGCSWEIWNTIVAKKDVDPELAIQAAVAAHDSDVWDTIFRNENVISYIKTLGTPEMLELADKSFHSQDILRYVIEKPNVTNDELFDCIVRSDHEELCALVFENESFKQFLSGLEIVTLIDKAKIIGGSHIFWSYVLRRSDFKTEFAISLFSLNNSFVTQELMQLPHIVQYIAELSVKDSIDLLKVNNVSLSKAILRREDVTHYITTCEKADALTILRDITWKDARKRVFMRTDLDISDLITYVKNEDDVMNISNLRKFEEFLRKIPINDAVSLAKTSGLKAICDVVLARKELVPAELIAFAKEVGTSHVWDIVRSRKDVKKYLEIQ